MQKLHSEPGQQVVEPGFFHGSLLHRVFQESGPAERSGRVFRCAACSRAKPRAAFPLVHSGADRALLSAVCLECEADFWRCADLEAYPDLRPFCLRITAALLRAAAREGGLLTVSAADLASLFIEQQGRCALTGQQLSLKAGRGEQNATKAVIDRAEPAAGFIRPNLQWVTLGVFRVKSAAGMSNDELVRLSRAIVAAQAERELRLIAEMGG